MRPCREMEPALYDRAAGALAPGDAARVEAHLAACPACRAEAELVEEALALAKLEAPAPALSSGGAAREGDLARSALARWRRRRRVAALAVGTGVLAAASAAALLVIAPALHATSRPAVHGVVDASRVAPGAAGLGAGADAAAEATAGFEPDEEGELTPEELALAALDAADGD
jgi:predicted anti-sigma-YlaC factor YlaD